MLKIIGREIAKQQKRLGGDFAVAYAVVSRESGALQEHYWAWSNVRRD